MITGTSFVLEALTQELRDCQDCDSVVICLADTAEFFEVTEDCLLQEMLAEAIAHYCLLKPEISHDQGIAEIMAEISRRAHPN